MSVCAMATKCVVLAGSDNHAQGAPQKCGAVYWRMHAEAQPVHSVRVYVWRQCV